MAQYNNNNDIKYLTPIAVDTKRKKYCRFKKNRIKYNLNLSYSKTHAQDNTFISAWIQSNRVYLDKSNERLTKSSRTYADYLIENTINYNGKIGLHNIDLVAGMTYEEENTNTLTAWGINLLFIYEHPANN